VRLNKEIMTKTTEGICKLCGKHKKLTFEHIPPEGAFNDVAVKVYPFEEAVKLYAGLDGRLPWDFSGLKWDRIQQRGGGDFFLCSECNNNTGSWYISEYTKLANIMHDIIESLQPKPGDQLAITLKDIYPQRIFKAIMTMFCDINNGCFGDEQLREYILNREATAFNTSKYSVFLYLVDRNMRRTQDLCVVGHSDVGIVTLSEIASYPIGVTLYIDRPLEYKAPGLCINDFACYCFKLNILHGKTDADGVTMTSKMLSGSKVKELLDDEP